MIGETQKRLRAWFQRHKWHTSTPPSGNGFWLESPVQNKTGVIHKGEDGKYFVKEAYLEIELDRELCDSVCFRVFERKQYYKDGKPTGDFSEWTQANRAPSISLPAKDIVKLAELIQAAQDDWMRSRKSKNHLNFFESIAKSCKKHWIGVNSSYEEINRMYGDGGTEIKVYT